MFESEPTGKYRGSYLTNTSTGIGSSIGDVNPEQEVATDKKSSKRSYSMWGGVDKAFGSYRCSEEGKVMAPQIVGTMLNISVYHRCVSK